MDDRRGIRERDKEIDWQEKKVGNRGVGYKLLIGVCEREIVR